jgi:hypothetical protein
MKVGDLVKLNRSEIVGVLVKARNTGFFDMLTVWYPPPLTARNGKPKVLFVHKTSLKVLNESR